MQSTTTTTTTHAFRLRTRSADGTILTENYVNHTQKWGTVAPTTMKTARRRRRRRRRVLTCSTTTTHRQWTAFLRSWQKRACQSDCGRLLRLLLPDRRHHSESRSRSPRRLGEAQSEPSTNDRRARCHRTVRSRTAIDRGRRCTSCARVCPHTSTPWGETRQARDQMSVLRPQHTCCRFAACLLCSCSSSSEVGRVDAFSACRALDTFAQWWIGASSSPSSPMSCSNWRACSTLPFG